MPTIRLEPLVDALGGPTPATHIELHATAERAGTATARIAGPKLTAPARIVATYRDGAWSSPLVLDPLPASYYWRLRIIDKHRATDVITRCVVVPQAAGAVDFGALIDVDPHTDALPAADLAQWEAVLAQTTADARATAKDRLDTLGFRTDARTARDEARTARTAAEAAQGAAEYAAGITGPALESTALAAAIDAVMGSGGQLHHGAGVPRFVDGSRAGDYYLDSTTGRLYRLETGA